MNFLRQKDGTELSKAQRVPFLGYPQPLLILKLFYFHPLRSRNLRCTWQASTGHDDLEVNLPGDVDTRKEPMEKVETGKLCQDD